MLQNIWPFGLAMFHGDISESINRFRKHAHNEHSNGGGGGGFQGDEMDEVSGCKWLAILREASVQAQCMTWLFVYFYVSWVVHGGPRLQVPCSSTHATCRVPLDRLFIIMANPNAELIEQIMEQVLSRAF